eukprot:4066863-Amphidinium_carterae.1
MPVRLVRDGELGHRSQSLHRQACATGGSNYCPRRSPLFTRSFENPARRKLNWSVFESVDQPQPH